MSSDGGKGSAPRPFSVNRKTFEDNWDKIFNSGKWDHYSDLPSPESYNDNSQDSSEKNE